MEKKLNGYSYDKKMWKVELDNQDYLCLVRLSDSSKRYPLGLARHVSSITQISQRKFVVLKTYSDGSKYVKLCRIPKEGMIEEVSSVLYEHSCEFWSDTTVLLDGSIVYDLSNDKCISKYYNILNSLKAYRFSSILLKRLDNHEYLYCIKEVFSDFGRGDFLQLVVDAETCKPVMPVYSTLRHSPIELTDTFTFKDLLEEEKRYKEIVDQHLIDISMAAGEKILLYAFNKEY